MESMDVERGDVNTVTQTVRSLLDLVGEKQNVPKFSPSIYKAPSTFRDLSPSSFTPRVVSIGPLHRNDTNLQRFEVRKAAFVHDLLCRCLDSSPKETLTACVNKVSSLIERVKGSYGDIKQQPQPNNDDSELIKIMVMDACFILEFVRAMPKDSNLRLGDQHIPYDLLLLENQIPFFVLKDIYDCTLYNFEERLPLTVFMHPLLQYTNVFTRGIRVGGGGHAYSNHDHILAYLYHCYRPTHDDISSAFPRSTVHSAAELDLAGVSFKPNEDAEWPLAMEVKRSRYFSSLSCFSLKPPTLTIPALRIDDFTELVLRNLIVYEQSYAVYPYVTSYARAMDMLVDTHEDVAKLVSSKVMVNHIGSNEEAANMINKICKEVSPEYFCYSQEWEELDIHFNSYWPSKIVKLRRDYFSSPWSIIALFAGTCLFLLTLIQTIFTVKPS